MDNFYIVLPSNTHNKVSRNTSSHFKTTLINPIELKGDYECCLHEISYYQSFNTITQRNNEVTFVGYKKENPLVDFQDLFDGLISSEEIDPKDYPGEFKRPPEWYTTKRKRRLKTIPASINPGIYRFIGPIIDGINEIRPKFWDSRLRLTTKHGRKFVQIELNKFAIGIEFHPVLSQMLGFKNEHYQWGKQEKDYTFPGDRIEYFDPEGKKITLSDPVELSSHDICIVTASQQPDVKACFYNIFVYTNIIKNTMVGDSLVPLLRTVQNEDLRNPYVTRSFKHNIYSPLKTEFIPEIEILLCDETGTQLEFNVGKTIVVLHFRKRKYTL